MPDLRYPSTNLHACHRNGACSRSGRSLRSRENRAQPRAGRGFVRRLSIPMFDQLIQSRDDHIVQRITLLYLRSVEIPPSDRDPKAPGTNKLANCGLATGALAAFVLGKILEISLIFLRFFLRARSRSNSVGATGLGKFICARCLRAAQVSLAEPRAFSS